MPPTSFATFLAPAWSTSLTVILAPADENLTANAWPIPPAAPVMTTDFPDTPAELGVMDIGATFDDPVFVIPYVSRQHWSRLISQ
ncbi:exported hypothetical protein [Rhodococcus ruber]|uniref:Uncharacterized protein n=1 Tax=Rhodococcus ruber TaxID=1830 RepID=A0A098BSB3_9NOCA|nr:exported hypothetical protein [Rhodococcus ruber]